MKVLWFAITPSMYSTNKTSHNGCGWIASLEALLRDVKDVNLGVAFEHQDNIFKTEIDGVSYYPINAWKSKWKRFKKRIIYQTEEKEIIPRCLKVIEDFKPDVIHVFGSEWCFGLVAQYTSIPVIIHMQGSIPPYYNARFPPGYNKNLYYFSNGINLKQIVYQLLADKFFYLRGEREERILRLCQFYMGRTEWDKNIVSLYAPKSKYYYCSEAIRSSFLTTGRKWEPHNSTIYTFVTTISSPLYKGSDLILKTAKLLLENTNIKFRWHVFGLKQMKVHEKKTGITAADVGVISKGTVSDSQLIDEILKGDIYLHPSYIDNSPNSICEAQILGIPIISTNVGGISSMISHNITGLLVPANDPFTMASYIIKLLDNQELAISMALKAQQEAVERHRTDNIIADLLSTYQDVVK